jgi:BMFP domain-containing protein YqiC
VRRPPFENFFDRASEFISHTTPEVERRVKQMVQSTLARMDLVTREEFDAQARVLQTTRARLESLEKKLWELEEDQHPEKKEDDG